MQGHRWVAVALVLAMGVAPARAIVIRDDVSDATAVSLAAPDHAVGKLLNRNRLDCTATLIAPRWALTAAHCVSGIRFPRLEFSGQEVPAQRWYIHSQWNERERQGYDIALVRLARPVLGITPATLYRQRDEVGQSVRIVGYGDHGDGLTGAVGFDARRRAGTNVIDRVETVRGGRPLVLVTDFDRPSSPDVSPYEATTASGDSGGPLFIGGALAGVTSWGSSDFSEYGDVARYTRVSRFVRWVDQILQNDRRGVRQALLGQPGDRLVTAIAPGRSRAGALSTDVPAAVPEPAALTLLLAWAGVLLRRGRARVPAPVAARV